MRKIFVAGNWKMNKTVQEVKQFFSEIKKSIVDKNLSENLKIFIAPAFPFIALAKEMTENTPIIIGAQNVSEYERGAFTGEVSAEMLKSLNLEYCIVGHSERRKYFGDVAQNIPIKLKLLKSKNIKPIFCVGESLEEREDKMTNKVIVKQLQEGLSDYPLDSADDLVIAYEPVWAIGTGKTATPQQAQEIHKLIRNWLENHYSKNISQHISLLYGGSVKPKNIDELLNQPDIDGGLIGGASMDVKMFTNLIESGLKKV
ncbi:MAG: triose-phosphate isomerase [Candidatus Cloacimonadota bacterium]|nr:triose-phosphate isomerase [Candidatus Cloacimonadota bacterium]